MRLDTVVPWGRSLDEYRLMFGLTDADLNLKILGCGDGPASFNSEMTAAGRRVTSIDPIYAFSKDEIRQRVQASYAQIISQLKRDTEPYSWTYFRDPDHLGQARIQTMELFLQDFDRGLEAKRYLPEEMPRLGFPDNHFQLALSSHFLFLYGEQLTLEFHVDSIYELLRVADEVRIFPLLDLECKRCPYVGYIWNHFLTKGYAVEVKTVNYEFQGGGNQMMKIARRTTPAPR